MARGAWVATAFAVLGDASCARHAEVHDAGRDASVADLPEIPLPALPPSVERPARRVVGEMAPVVCSDLGEWNLPRGAIQRDADGPHFLLHAAIGAAAIGDDWIVVLARSGVWLLERATLAVRARLETNGEGDIAASPDGRHFAFARCAPSCTLEMRSFPSLEHEASVPIDRPYRIRFSHDGAQIAVASAKKNSATLVDVATHAVLAHVVDKSDVNDVIVLPFGTTVAYGTNDDETVVRDWFAKRDLWRDRPSILGGLQLSFDQNALAYDEARDVLFTGGNDNAVYRIASLRAGTPRFVPGSGVGFANDVWDLAMLPGDRLAVALDSGSVEILTVDTKTLTSIGTLGRSTGMASYGARIHASHDDLVGVLGGIAFRWTPPRAAPPPQPESRRGCLPSGEPSPPPPQEPTALQSRWFHKRYEWIIDEGPEDAVLVATMPDVHQSYRVARVSWRAPEPLDVVAEPAGAVEFPMHVDEVVALSDRTRLVLGAGPHDELRVARVPPSAPVGPAKDLGVQRAFGNHPVRADGARVAYVGKGNVVVELSATAERTLGALGPGEELFFEAKHGMWMACKGRGVCRLLGP